MTENEKPLEAKITAFTLLMLEKFYRRVAKHPGEASVTHPDYDWASTNLTDIEHHLIYEFLERFPQFIDRFPEISKDHLTIDAPETEDVDLANLAFVDWAVREARNHTKTENR